MSDILYYCEKCGIPVYEKFGSGRFCSRACANSREQTSEINKKRSQSVKDYYLDKKKDNHKVCKICGSVDCNDDFCKSGNKLQQIKTLVKYFGFDISCLGTPDVKQEWDRIRNNLYKLYHIDHISSTDIAKIYNYPSPCNLPGKVFIYLDIPSKTCHQANLENYGCGKLAPHSNNRYKSGWHTTWYGDNVYLRSSYEFNLADKLDDERIYYTVESVRVKYFDSQKGYYRTAITDFYTPNNNTIIEVKSEFTLDKVNMLDKAKEYLKQGYNFMLLLDGIKYDINYLEEIVNCTTG